MKVVSTLLVLLVTTITNCIVIADEKPKGLTALIEEKCDFLVGVDWPEVTCYQMKVPENYSHGSKQISFPVIKFHAKDPKDLPPVLHLGAGGPGASMGLYDGESVRAAYSPYDDFTINNHRDLYVIDPRGIGLSEPSLSCENHFDFDKSWLNKNYGSKKYWKNINKNIKSCINSLKKNDIDFTQYHSMNVVKDIEQLRSEIGANQLTLIGISYGSVFAQFYTEQFPKHVESLILDSPVLLGKSPYQTTKEIEALEKHFYQLCELSEECDISPSQLKKQIWDLYSKYKKSPKKLTVLDGNLIGAQPIKLTAERFIHTLLGAAYNPFFSEDIADILYELQNDQHEIFKVYLEDQVLFSLFAGYGSNLSYFSEYCYFYDIGEYEEVDRKQIQALSNPSFKEFSLQSLYGYEICNWLGYKEWPEIDEAYKFKTQVPTLILQTKYDIATPLKDTYELASGFENHYLFISNTAHSVLSYSDCAEDMAVEFLNEKRVRDELLSCDD